MENIVMVDLDGVVLDRKYKITTNIVSIVNKAKKVLEIVPNSDTPIKRLYNLFFNSLQIESKILVGENGAIVKNFSETIFTCDIGNLEQYKKIIKLVFQEIGAQVVFGDIPIWIKKGKKFPPFSKLVLIDNLRQQSVSVYFLVTDKDGNLCIRDEWGEYCLDILASIGVPFGMKFFDYNREYGIAISSPKKASKTLGYLVLKKRYPKANFFIIGDSQNDIILDKSVVHLSVNNASEKLKSISFFVSNFSYTKGLGDCFTWILKNI